MFRRPSFDKFKLQCEIAGVLRKIKLRAFFQNTTDSREDGDTGLRNKTTFTPPPAFIPVEILAFEQGVMRDIEALDSANLCTFNNLSKAEQKSLSGLQTNSTIIIKPADKGGGIVIQSVEAYRTECLRLLEDRRNYGILQVDPTERQSIVIASLVEEAVSNQWIVKNEADFLVNRNPRTPYFYILPKVPKQRNPSPGRPIVSGIGSLLEPLSQFCESDSFLKPTVQATPRYFRDTKDILIHLQDFEFNPTRALLVGLDVESLYTSLPHDETLQVLEEVLMTTTWNYNTPQPFILECARLAMTENIFGFEDSLYIQRHGTSMGSTFAPSVAGLYVYNMEKRIILSDQNPHRNKIK